MTLIVRVDRNGLATLTLNRPEKLNSLTTALFDELLGHIDDIERDTDHVGAVLLRGAGRCFCAGNDIESIARGTGNRPIVQSKIVARLADLTQPVVAAVHGYCFTGGLELALAADIILASANAQFADTHAKWGLTSLWGMSQRLPRRIGASRASEMMFTARRYSGAQAAAMGLANHCFSDDVFDEEVDAFAADIVANAWVSHRENKRMLRQTDGMALGPGLAHEITTHIGVTGEAERRLEGFLDRASRERS